VRVYWASVEFTCNNDPKAKGGFVYAFVKAVSRRSAIERIETALEEQGFTPVRVEFAKPYAPGTKWDNPDHAIHYRRLYDLAQEDQEVVLDDFYLYESEE
jgi:hypothetical protein